MNKQLYKKDQNISNRVNRPSYSNPALLELLIDFSTFTRKWTTTEIANVMGISRQALDKHIQKKKKGETK